MATKKKKKDNNKKKYSGSKKIYSLRSLEEIVKSADQKFESGEPLSEYEEKLCFAAKQTLEFVKAAAEKGVKLDLSKESEYFINRPLVALGLDKQESGEDEAQIVNELSEIAGSYLLFEQINMLWAHGAIGELYYDPEVSDNVVIKAHAFMKTKSVMFDVYDAINRVSDKTFIFRDVTPKKVGVDGRDAEKPIRGLMVGFGPYSILVENELLFKL